MKKKEKSLHRCDNCGALFDMNECKINKNKELNRHYAMMEKLDEELDMHKQVIWQLAEILGKAHGIEVNLKSWLDNLDIEKQTVRNWENVTSIGHAHEIIFGKIRKKKNEKN